jgi:hypothetical protein
MSVNLEVGLLWVATRDLDYIDKVLNEHPPPATSLWRFACTEAWDEESGYHLPFLMAPEEAETLLLRSLMQGGTKALDGSRVIPSRWFLRAQFVEVRGPERRLIALKQKRDLNISALHTSRVPEPYRGPMIPNLDWSSLQADFPQSVLGRKRLPDDHKDALESDDHESLDSDHQHGVGPVFVAAGTPGRPTAAHMVQAEFERRVRAGEADRTLASEARALQAYLNDERTRQPGIPPLTSGSIENVIREAHRSWKTRAQK